MRLILGAMKDRFEALDTTLLPQYQSSAAFMERFLVAAHAEGSPIERSVRTSEKIRLVDGSELDADFLRYFTDNKEAFREEFMKELRTRSSALQKEFDEFCDVVAFDWFDGRRLRQEGRSRRLRRSVLDYLVKVRNAASLDRIVQVQPHPTDVEPLISIESVAAILTVNDQMIYRHVEAWKSEHPNSDSLSSDDVFLRRGLALEHELNTSELYREWDFINSYSIAFSAPEKFSRIIEGRIPAIVNGDLGLFEGRILFFSPFIPKMEVGQLEFGIIPSDSPLPIHLQGRHAGITEYIIDPPPFQKTAE